MENAAPVTDMESISWVAVGVTGTMVRRCQWGTSGVRSSKGSTETTTAL